MTFSKITKNVNHTTFYYTFVGIFKKLKISKFVLNLIKNITADPKDSFIA